MEANDIIKTAFKVWGDDMYMKTSLSTLSSALNITKPALYRYFKDKDRLLKSMLDYYIEQHSKATVKILSDIKEMDFRSAFQSYASVLYNLYEKNDGFFYFAAKFLLQHEHPFHKQLLKLIAAEADVLVSVLHRQTELSEKEIERILTVSVTHMMFWCELAVGKNKIPFTDGKYTAVEYMVESLFNGFMPNHDPSGFYPEKIESALTIEEHEIPKLSARVEAIINVIASEGFHNASISKIANALNISKSSLYSLFKDKTEMLKEVIFNYRELLSNTGMEKLQSFDDPFDRFYGYFHLILLLLKKDEKKARFLNWLRFQNIQPNEKKAGFHFEPHQVVKDIIESGAVEQYGLRPQYIEGCFRVQLVRDVLNRINKQQGLDNLETDFREIFICLAFGLHKKYSI